MPGSRTSRDPPNTATGFRLLTRTIPVGERYWRFYRSHHANPLGWDVTAQSRFSDPKRRNFAVVYGAQTFTGSFVETIIRDARDGIGSNAPVRFTEIRDRSAVVMEVRTPLTLVDLTGRNPVNMGVPSDALRWSRHHVGQRSRRFSTAIRTGQMGSSIPPASMAASMWPSMIGQ